MIRVVHIGLGPLGQKMVRYAADRSDIEIVGAVDTDPDKIGKDVGELSSVAASGVVVSGSLDEAVAGNDPNVALLTTVSDLKRIEPQIATIVKKGLPIVSTCEELSFPWKINPEVAARIDSACLEGGVACLGTGVNPGFLMDYLPTVLSSVCQRVDKVTVSRFQDACSRRIPFQKKIGAGMTVEEFRAKEAEGVLRHVGLPESIDLIAHSMGWRLDRTTESLDPIIAQTEITSGFQPISAGMASGVEQIGLGFVGDKEVIRLHFRAAVGEPESFDRVEIDGEPAINSTISGGVNGDIATCAITLNAMRSVVRMDAGLKTMLDVPVPGFFYRS